MHDCGDLPLKYVLITPARNEASHIEKTLQSVAAQSVLPEKWVIVSDASTDGTDDIVRKYAEKYLWLTYLRIEAAADRNFASKVRTFNAGYELVRETDYQIIGNLDADVVFESGYMGYLLAKFKEDPELGVAGTDYIEGDFHSFRDSYISDKHVNGQIQLFRRNCFEEIGGYTPIPHGGIDWVAVTTARMKGWKTRSFDEKTYTHLRPMGTAGKSTLRMRYDYGQKDYFLGNHPLWEVVRGFFQMKSRPYLISGVFILAGYFSCWFTRKKRPISRELLLFNRKEQMERLKKLFSSGSGNRGWLRKS